MQFVVQPRLKNQDWSYCTHQRQTTDLYIRLHVIETSWKFKKTPKCANVLVDNIKIINKIKDPPPQKKIHVILLVNDDVLTNENT